MMKRYAVLGIIIALVVSIAAIGCSSGSSKPKSTPTPTQAPTQTATPTATATPTSEPTAEPTATPTTGPNEAALATSLDFTIQVDTENVSYTYRYRARNIGTSSLDIRVDVTSAQMNAVYIVSGSSQQAWIYSDGQWLDVSQMFDIYWDTWNGSFVGYQTALAEEWTGLQDWTHTVPGVGTVTYTNIEINPALPDSIFQPD